MSTKRQKALRQRKLEEAVALVEAGILTPPRVSERMSLNLSAVYNALKAVTAGFKPGKPGRRTRLTEGENELLRLRLHEMIKAKITITPSIVRIEACSNSFLRSFLELFHLGNQDPPKERSF